MPVEAPAPVLEPPVAQQTASRSCLTCGTKLTDGRRRYCSDACKTKRNGQAGAPLPAVTERPLRVPNYEAEEVAQALEVPKLPWQTR
jgi:hypothetical protein